MERNESKRPTPDSLSRKDSSETNTFRNAHFVQKQEKEDGGVEPVIRR